MKSLRKMSLLLLMMTMLLAACGDSGSNKSSDASKRENKAVHWHNFAGDDLRAKTVRGLIEKFAEEHPEVELDAQAIPPDGYRQH